MKKILYLICAAMMITVASAGQLAAQDNDRASQVIAALTAKLGSMGAYGADIRFTSDDISSSGSFVVSGDSYRLTLDKLGPYAGVSVFSDGNNKYEINEGAQEVVISGVSKDDNDMLTNPAKAFNFPQDIFSYAYKGEQTIGGKVADVVELKPRKAGQEIVSITLSVERQSSLPVQVRYSIDGMDDMVIEIANFGKRNVSAGEFRFSRSDYKGYEVIDFR